MGVIKKLLYRGQTLKETPHRNFFLDMEENIHIHYRDLRIELSRDEFEEIVTAFTLQSKELMQIIQERDYQDGQLANANQDDVRIWTESRLTHKVKYYPRQISIEECTDGFHIHLRNNKILLDREDFTAFLDAMKSVDLSQPYASDIEQILQLLQDNHIDFAALENNGDANCELIVADYHEVKIRSVLQSIGLKRTVKNKSSIYNGQDNVSIQVRCASQEKVTRLSRMQSQQVSTLLTAHLIQSKPVDPDYLNKIACQVLDMFSYVKQCDKTPDIDLDYTSWTYNAFENRVIFPFKITHNQLSAIEIRKKYRQWNTLLKQHNLFFIKPTKIRFNEDTQEKTVRAVMEKISTEVAKVDGIAKIYIMGSVMRNSMGVYKEPFIHSEWAKLASDVDLLIEMKSDKEYNLPESWEYINISQSNSCKIYHIGEIPMEDPFGYQKQYPNIKFFHHLLDAYIYIPQQGDVKKKDAFLKRFQAKLCFASRETSVKNDSDKEISQPEKKKDDELAAVIEEKLKQEYGIIPVNLSRLKAATENDIYRFTLNEKRYILKCYKVSGNYSSTRLIEHANYEAEIITAIKNSNILTADLIRTKDNKAVIDINGFAAILYSYVEGRIYKYPDPQYPIPEAAQVLANLHRKQLRKPLKLSKRFSSEDVFNIWHKEYDRYAKEVTHDVELSEAFESLNPIYDTLTETYQYINNLKGLPWVHNHGDVSPMNFVISNGVATLIDFQNAFYGPRLFDVIDGSYEFSFTGRPPGTNDFKRFDIFLKNYTGQTPLIEIEKKCINDVIKILGIIKFLKEVRMIKGSHSKNHNRRLRALSVAHFLAERFSLLQGAIYNPKSLAIRISYQCNISCRFCYNNSTADSKIKLTEKQIISIIEEAQKKGFDKVGLSGGEALMHRDAVLNAIRRAKELGYSGVSLVSNGFWAKTETSANNLLTSLHDTGLKPPLDMFSISAGEFHHEWLDWTYAKHAILEFYRIFKHPLSIDFETTPKNKQLIDEFREYVTKEGIKEEQYNLRERKIIANLGRWKDLDQGIIRQKPISSFGKCNTINRFVVQPNGDVVPCCGFNRYNTGIILGNVLTSSVSEVIAAAQTNLANRYLTDVPLHVIYEELCKKFVLPDKFSVICELCELLFSNKEYMDYLEDKFELLSKRQSLKNTSL